MSDEDCVIAAASVDDAATVLRFIRELAEYEREPDAVELTLDALRDQLASPRPPFECAIARRQGEAVGFALFFHNYSTWRGRRGLYLEDLYVTPAARGPGSVERCSSTSRRWPSPVVARGSSGRSSTGTSLRSAFIARSGPSPCPSGRCFA